jgi:hypothetical protein
MEIFLYDLARMLPDRRWGQEEMAGSLRERYQVPDLLNLTEMLVVFERDEQSVFTHFRIGEHLAEEGFVGHFNASTPKDWPPLAGHAAAAP